MSAILELTKSDISHFLPARKPDTHKGDYGKVLLLCGAEGFTGAAYLSAMGALRTGSGLVYLGVPRSIYAIEAVKLNEAVVFPLPDEAGMLSQAAVPAILEKLPSMDAVLIGCGLGQSAGTLAVLRAVLSHAQCPVVVDADGINLLSAHKDIVRSRIAPTVLTPHDGEFARLFGAFPGDDRIGAARALSKELGAVVLLKGHRTIITDGEKTYRNTTGNPGMAVGGSGDLLAGIIVSLLGQGLAPCEAASLGACLHGLAGDRCAEAMGQPGMLPTDMLEILPQLLR